MKIQNKKFCLSRKGENRIEIFLEDNNEKVTTRYSSASEYEIRKILSMCGYTESLVPEKRSLELHVYCQELSSDEEIELIESLSPEELEEWNEAEAIEKLERLQVS